jgi:hypothetical protein
MRRTTAITVVLLALTACAADDSTDPLAAVETAEATTEVVEQVTTATTEPVTTAAPTYPAFTDIDPYTSEYFIALEGTDLATTLGEALLFEAGVNVCRDLDAGSSIGQELDNLGHLGDDSGSIVGAAVTDFCPHHGQLVEDYLAANS